MLGFYIALCLVSIAGVFLVRRLLRKHPANGLIGVWICLATGAGFLLIYALEGDHNLFNFSIGLVIVALAAIALIGAKFKRST